jgi:hypothetical protein
VTQVLRVSVGRIHQRQRMRHPRHVGPLLGVSPTRKLLSGLLATPGINLVAVKCAVIGKESDFTFPTAHGRGPVRFQGRAFFVPNPAKFPSALVSERTALQAKSQEDHI